MRRLGSSGAVVQRASSEVSAAQSFQFIAQMPETLSPPLPFSQHTSFPEQFDFEPFNSRSAEYRECTVVWNRLERTPCIHHRRLLPRHA